MKKTRQFFISTSSDINQILSSEGLQLISSDIKFVLSSGVELASDVLEFITSGIEHQMNLDNWTSIIKVQRHRNFLSFGHEFVWIFHDIEEISLFLFLSK